LKIVWSSRASFQLDQIYEYIASDSPEAAEELVRFTRKRVERVAQYPRMGASEPAPRKNRRKLLLLPYPYVVRYRVKRDEIRILTIRHTARKPLER
jgi:plasmid stabilization system protein ParE